MPFKLNDEVTIKHIHIQWELQKNLRDLSEDLVVCATIRDPRFRKNDEGLSMYSDKIYSTIRVGRMEQAQIGTAFCDTIVRSLLNKMKGFLLDKWEEGELIYYEQSNGRPPEVHSPFEVQPVVGRF